MNENDVLDSGDPMKVDATTLAVVVGIRRMAISVVGRDGKMVPVLDLLVAAWANPANALLPDLDPSIQFEGGMMSIEEIARQDAIWLQEIASCPPRRKA